MEDDMFGKKQEEKNPNEVVFSKTKGFSYINYAILTTKALFNETSVLVERVNKILFFKGKPKTDTVEFNTIESVVIKNHFSKGDLISGIIIGLLAIIIGASSEEGSVIFIGLLVTAFLVFCSWGKNIVITKKNGEKINLLCEALSQSEEIETFTKKLGEKGISVQGGKK